MKNLNSSYRYLLLILVFTCGFLFSLVIVLISAQRTIESKAHFYLSEFLDYFNNPKNKEQINIANVEDYLLGKVIAVDIYGDFEHAANVLGELDWNDNPLYLQLETLTYHSKPLGLLYPEFYRIQEPEVLRTIIPKLRAKSLQDNSFFVQSKIMYIRDKTLKISSWMHLHGSFLLYQHLKIFSQTSKPLDIQNKEDQFFLDLSKTYLYNQNQKSDLEKFDYPNSSFLNRHSFLLCYLPMVQGIFILDLPTLSLSKLILLDPLGFILCIIIGLFLAIIVYILSPAKQQDFKHLFLKNHR